MRRLLLPLLFFLPALTLYAQRTTGPDQYIADRFIDSTGREVVRIIVPGKPPDHFRMPAVSPSDASASLSNVPAYDWSFGCSATSAAMMAGYYDRTGYANMYAGPTNGGVAPMDNSVWGTIVINGETRSQCPISATRNGLDGRTIRGHVDDYWIVYGNPGPDPFIVNGWTEHTYSGCTGDYMKTNQSTYNNIDGATWFYNYGDGSPYSGPGNNNDDGMYGINLFFQSRGYTVTSYFNQYIYGWNGNTLGFTFAQYKAQINAGRPVLIQVQGHTMLGMGYNDTGSLVYLHDTWDYSTHQMTWGGTYADMAHYGVGVIQLQPLSDPCANITSIGGCGSGYQQTFSGGGTGVWFTSSNSACGWICPGAEKVYSFVAPYSGNYSIQVTAASGYVDYMWKTSSCASSGWTCIDDIYTTGQYGAMTWTAGTTYYILLDDEDNTAGTHTFYINCPIICYTCPSYNFSITPSTTWLNHNSSHISTGCKMYRVSVTSGQPYIFKTGCGNGAAADYDTFLELYNSSCTPVASNDDGCGPLLSIISWTATYTGYAYLKVRGYGSASGSYTLAYIKNTVPTTRNLQNINVLTGQSPCYDATQTLTTAGSGTTFIVQNGGDVNLISGGNILMYPGTSILSGSYLMANITTNGSYCYTQAAPAPQQTKSIELIPGVFAIPIIDNQKSAIKN